MAVFGMLKIVKNAFFRQKAFNKGTMRFAVLGAIFPRGVLTVQAPLNIGDAVFLKYLGNDFGHGFGLPNTAVRPVIKTA